MGLEITRLDGKAVLRLVLEPVVAKHDNLLAEINRFRGGRRSRAGLGDVLGCGSPGLGLLLACGEKEARQKESGQQTHIFPISATDLFATLLSEWLAVRRAQPRSELIFHGFAH